MYRSQQGSWGESLFHVRSHWSMAICIPVSAAWNMLGTFSPLQIDRVYHGHSHWYSCHWCWICHARPNGIWYWQRIGASLNLLSCQRNTRQRFVFSMDSHSGQGIFRARVLDADLLQFRSTLSGQSLKIFSANNGWRLIMKKRHWQSSWTLCGRIRWDTVAQNLPDALLVWSLLRYAALLLSAQGT